MTDHTLVIGKKYLFTGKTGNPNLPTEEGLIFVELMPSGLGVVARDDQALFNALQQPYQRTVFIEHFLQNPQTIKTSLNTFTYPMTDESMNSLWQSKEQVQAEINDAMVRLRVKQQQLSQLNCRVFYGTDCPQGETYQAFINEFTHACAAQKICLNGFTFHGMDNENSLSIAHNGSDENDTDNVTTPTTIFFELQRNPAYQRLDLIYCHSINQPELRSV
jgi:hypothetical protein